MRKEILFFADRLPPLTGGVEMHARYFIEHFSSHSQFPITGIITKNKKGQDCLISKEKLIPITFEKLKENISPAFVFFNSGRWIEELPQLREIFKDSFFLYRTGGNEILKAPLIQEQIEDHSLRQQYWALNLNSTLDVLITNSEYTENRLRNMGITCPFKRVVGGVNASALRIKQATENETINIFCSARFVPYKNHLLLLKVIKELYLRNHKLKLRLAGDGPLLAEAKAYVLKEQLSSVVEFLGVLDNEKTCKEIAKASLYMQLSSDHITEVPGGSYIHSEGMGRSILEAITAGTFVIAGDSGALSEIVTSEEGALLDISDLHQLTDRVEQIIKNLPEKKPFNNRYSWNLVFEEYMKLFRDLYENTSCYRKV